MKFKFLYSWIGLSLIFLLFGNSKTEATPTKDWSFAPICTTPIISTFPSTETFDVLVPNDGSIFACITTDNMTDCWINDTANPNMWTARSTSTGSTGTGPTTDNTSGSGNYVFLESSSCFNNVSYLYGPGYNITSLTAPYLSFYYHMYGTDMGTLALEATTNGTTWTPLWTLTGDQGNAWTLATVNLSAYAGSATLAFRFVGTTGAGFTSDMAIDAITVENIACPDPTTLTATNITSTTADLGWTEVGSATSWEVEYGLAGFTPGSGTTVTSTTNPYSVSGLAVNTSYDFYVRSDCGASGFSAWVGPFNFTTTIACPAPTALEAINVLDTQADLSWTAGGVETQWEVEYGPTGFTPGGGGTVVTVTTNPYNISGLTASTAYDFYVTADCGAGGMSSQVGPSTFVTQCPPSMAPYCQDFENGGTVPTCWRNFGLTDSWDFSIGPISGGHVGNGGTLVDHTSGTGYFAWVDDSSPHGLETTLQTPLIDVSGLTNPEVSFWIASDNEGNTNVDFSVNLWDGAAWNNAVFTSNTNTSGWLEGTIDLSLYTITGPVMVTFVVDENNGTDFWDDFAVDDVCFREKPSCTAVSLLTATNVLDSEALLGWTAGGTETQWIIEYGPTGFTPGTGMTVTVTTNPYTLTGLMPSTGYDYYVTSDCGAGGTGAQAGPITFVTQCSPVSAPWCGDFESAGSTPACWRNFGSESWNFSIGPIAGGHVGNGGVLVDHTSGSGYFAWVDDSTPQSIGTTLQTPLINTAGLGSPEVSFWIASDNEGFTNVDFTVNLWDGAAWQNAIYFSNTNTGGWLEVVIDLTTYTITGPIMLTFVVDETNGTDFYDDFAIDDICVRNKPICTAPNSLTAANITETTADLSWASAGTAFNLEYGPCGFAKGTGTGATATTTNYSVSGLMPGTCYEYYVQNDCGGPIANLVISGIGDGPLPGGQPKFVELYAAGPVPDLGIYGLESVNNGGGYNMAEYTFPAGVSLAQGSFIYITGDSAAFNMFFGFNADFIDAASTSINGDDAVALYENGAVIDVAGDPNMDGTGTTWEYLDGWMYRNAGTTNSSTFGVTDWTYSGINVFDGQTTNASSPTPFPLGTYDPPVSACAGPFAFTTKVGCGGPFYDNGGIANVYANSSNDTITICPQNPGDIVTVNFTAFDVEPRTDSTCWDALYIHDGGSAASPVIPSTAGTADWCWDALAVPQFGTGNLAGMSITSTDPSGCLTFVFFSDASVTFDGWEATVTCAPPPCPDPSGLNAVNVTHNTADLLWTSPGTSHIVEFDTTGFTPGTGTMETASTSPYRLENLIPNTTYDYYLKNNCGGPADDLQLVGIIDGDLPNNLHAVVLYANANIPDLSVYAVKQSTNGGGTVTYSTTLPAVPIAAGSHFYIGRQPSSFMAFFGFAADHYAAISLNGDDAVGLYENNVLIDIYGDYNVDGTGTNWDYTSGWALRNNNTPNNGGVFAPGDWTVNTQVFFGVDPNNLQPVPYPINAFVGSSGLGLSQCIGPFTFTTLCSPIATTTDSLRDVTCNGDSDGAIFITPLNGVLPYTFTWSNGNATEDVGGLAPGSYTVTIVDAVGCSYVSAPFTINEPILLDVTVDGFSNVSCNGGADGSISITPTGGTMPYSYNWSNGATSEDLTGLPAGAYYGTLTDANGCTSVGGPINITEPAMPITFSLDAMTNVSCNGGADGEIQITTTGGTSPYTYVWSNGAITEDITGLAAGTYEGTITDANGCVLSSGPVSISEPAPILMSATHVDATPGGGGNDGSIDLMVSGGTMPYAYLWNTGATTQDLTGISLGVYTVTVTDANGCTETYTQPVGNTAVEDIDELQKFELYPNPTNGQTQIVLEFEKPVNLNIRIVNVLGQVIHEEADNQVKANQYTIDMTKAAAGTYFVHLQVEGAIRTKQLVVTR